MKKENKNVLSPSYLLSKRVNYTLVRRCYLPVTQLRYNYIIYAIITQLRCNYAAMSAMAILGRSNTTNVVLFELRDVFRHV